MSSRRDLLLAVLCGLQIATEWQLVVGYNHPVLRTPLHWRGISHVDGCGVMVGCGRLWFVLDGVGVFFLGYMRIGKLNSCTQSWTCEGWQLYPAAQRGVQATARGPKLNDGDESLIAQKKKKGEGVVESHSPHCTVAMGAMVGIGLMF
jgi:hypothetical protein